MADPSAGTFAPIVLADAATDVGAMERLFIIETRSPGVPGYVAFQNLAAMRMMRQTIANRLQAPGRYRATGATTPTEIIEMGNQFAGFGSYPDLSASMQRNIDQAVSIANNPRHPHRGAYSQYVLDAITAATEGLTPVKASHADVTAWRTAEAGPPLGNFAELETLSGNTFYATMPVPPMPPHHAKHRRPLHHGQR